MHENKIEGKMFNNISDLKERETALETNCVRPEEMDVKEYFTEPQLADMRKEFADQKAIVQKKMEEYAKLKAEIMAVIKPAEEQAKYLLGQIRNGYVEVKKQVYLFDYQDENTMVYYDATGQIAYSRPLMPTERQSNVISMARTGTNN